MQKWVHDIEQYPNFHSNYFYNPDTQEHKYFILWAKDSEDVKLKEAWDAPGKFGLISSDAPFARVIYTQGATTYPQFNMVLPGPKDTHISSATTIKATAAGDGKYIEESDVDLSGHPAAMSHKIFGNVAYNFNFKDQPMFVGLGGSYEFADSNTALEQWAVWLKLAIAL